MLCAGAAVALFLLVLLSLCFLVFWLQPTDTVGVHGLPADMIEPKCLQKVSIAKVATRTMAITMAIVIMIVTLAMGHDDDDIIMRPAGGCLTIPHSL